MKERRNDIDVRRKRNVVEAAQRSCEAMKSTFDRDFEFREGLTVRDEMRTLETRDDFEFRLLFNPSEGEKHQSNQQPDIKRINRGSPKKRNLNSIVTTDLVDTKEVNRAFLQETELACEFNVTNKFTQHEATEPLSGLPADSYRSCNNTDQPNTVNHNNPQSRNHHRMNHNHSK